MVAVIFVGIFGILKCWFQFFRMETKKYDFLHLNNQYKAKIGIKSLK